MLNSDLTSVTGSNVKYVNLTLSGNLGSSPVSGGYLQLTRLYGYPHPTVGSGSSTGQSKIAAAANSILTGSGW